MGLLHRLWQQAQSQSPDAPRQVITDGKFNVVPHFIEGERLIAESDEKFELLNPLTGKPERKAYAASEKVIDSALRSAWRAQEEWAATGVDRRLARFRDFRELLGMAVQDLAAVLAQEEGCAREAAWADAQCALRHLDDAWLWRELLRSRGCPPDAAEPQTTAVPFPVGPVGVVEDGRLGFGDVVSMVVSTLMCGNAVILKPSLSHPSAAIFLSDLMQRASFPKGAFGVLQGGFPTAAALAAQPDLGGLACLGCDADSKARLRLAAASRCNVAIFDRSRFVAVVFPDCDVAVAAGRIASAFVDGCQTGHAVRAVYVLGDAQVDFASRLREALIDKMRRPEAQDGKSRGASEAWQLAPRADCERASRWVERLRSEEALFLIDPDDSALKSKCWAAAPAAVDFVSPGHPILDEAESLPILPISRVSDWDGAKESILACRTAFNACALFSRDRSDALRKASELKMLRQTFNCFKAGAIPFCGASGDSPEDLMGFLTRRACLAERWD